MRIRILVPLLLIALGATAQGKKTVFSTMETNHIRVATPGLFSQRELIELPLEDIPDTEYSFPLPGGKVISPYGRGAGTPQWHRHQDLRQRHHTECLQRRSTDVQAL